MFHWNGTASGFIKIYELNHHWKYKTLVRARGGDGRRGVSRGWRDDKEETEWERRNREGRTDCADLIWRNILGAISPAPADILFESSYQVKGFKSKKRGSDKEPVCLEMFGGWGESPSLSAAAIPLHRRADDVSTVFPGKKKKKKNKKLHNTH